MKRVFLSLFLFFITISGCFATNNATDIYLLAQTKSISELGKVEDIDVVDSDGNTALCSAIKDNNVDAYNLLKKAGADTGHKCVKKIPEKQYKAFTQKLVATNKSWSFLGIGKWTWAAIGAGVAGGAVVAGMGGGGSSGSGGGSGTTTTPSNPFNPYEELNCVYGTQIENVCVCDLGYTGDLCDVVYAVVNDGDILIDNTNTEITSATGINVTNGINATNISSGTITIKNTNTINGISATGSDSIATNYGLISIDNTDIHSGSASGIFVQDGGIGINANSGNITITNTNYALGLVANNTSSSIENAGTIFIDNSGQASAFARGMRAFSGTTATNTSTGSITITNTDKAYGIGAETNALAATNNGDIFISNTNEAHGISTGELVSTTNTDLGNITIHDTHNSYGIYGSNPINSGQIFIDNTNTADAVAYGIQAKANSAISNTTSGNILITNTYEVRGISTDDNTGSTIENIGTISIDNVYEAVGIRSYTGTLTNNSNSGNISIANAYFGKGAVLINSNFINSGTIFLENINSARGIYTAYGASVENTNTGNITITTANHACGIRIEGGTQNSITNAGTINITGADKVYGIYVSNDTPTTIINSGSVTVSNSNTSDDTETAGIYVKGDGSIIRNSGVINVTHNSNALTSNKYGIYAYGAHTYVYNTGIINLNNSTCTGSACHTGSFIRLDGGAHFVNSSTMQASALNLNSFGGNVVAGLGSQFVVDNELSGDLDISSELVQSGNQTTYIAENMIDAGNVSGLKVRSASAMFNASLADNGHDVVMQMKDFNELTDNKSLAAFLSNNYANGKGMELFSTLKSIDTCAAFTHALGGITGLDSFTQFAHEDLSAMREISLSMNNKLFENSNRDSFDISDSMRYFSFRDSHNSGSGQYGISSNKISDNWKLGYGMAMANIYTNDGDGFNRQNKMWMFYMPATYINDDIELVIISQAGFTNNKYNRRGYNNMNYEGYIEKRIFGLMNDLRYPLTFGNWTLAPDLAFNAIVYEQNGHEDGQEFSLIIPNDRTVSVETGLGLYSKYEKTFQNSGRLQFTSGIMGYREFGDTYDIKLGIRGMDGTFSLYNNDYKYRGALNVGIDYAIGNLHMYGNSQYFMDNANYMNFKGGISYRF